MSNLIVSVLAVCLPCAIAFANDAQVPSPQPHESWRSALVPTGSPAKAVTLADQGQALYTIVIPDSPSTVEEKAAADLARWLGEISGSRFAILREPEHETVSSGLISIGKTRLLSDAGLATATLDLGDEGYAIDEKGGVLFLIGGTGRGVLNAVYALLEEDLDCRWYSRMSQTIPERKVLKVAVAKRSYAPPLEIRDPYYRDAFDGTWSLRNRTNTPSAEVPPEWGGHKSHALFVHTFSTLVPPEKYFEEHPEYFSENNGERNTGQLCVTNPQVVSIAVDSARRILEAHPNADIISVSQNDSAPCCACDRCQAVTDAEGSLSGPLLQFVNAVAKEVAKEFPEVTISTLAYLDTSAPPKTVRPAPNVAIQLCTDSHAWSEPFLKIEETESFQARMKSWAAVGARIHIWDYTCNFSHYIGPMPNWQVVTDSIRFFLANNARGVMLQGNYQTTGGADTYMRCWVWAKLLWDPTRDTRALMKDFVFGYFGQAAEPVWAYQQLLWNTWEEEHNGYLRSPQNGIRYPMTLFSEEFMARARVCFAEAGSLDLDEETRRRVESMEVQVLYAEVERRAAAGTLASPEGVAILDRFEAIARRLGVTHLQEGEPNFGNWLEGKRRLGE